MTTAADAPNGTERINAISTVGMEISASTTTTDVDRERTVIRDTMAATSSQSEYAADDDDGEHGDHEIRAGAGHQPAQHVGTGAVGAQRVRCGRARPTR